MSDSELESNEAEWWSHWASFERLGDGYLLHSKVFLEPLFNHAGLFQPPRNPHEFIQKAEERYQALGIQPSFIVKSTQDYSPIGDQLRAKGYTVADHMHVMLLEGSIGRRSQDVEVVVADNTLIDLWSTIYVSSFEEDPRLLGAVKRIAASLLANPAVKLLVATYEGKPSGVTALYTSGRITGAYCVGTIKEKRRRGVATTLLGYAEHQARSTGTHLVLQTFESDGVEGFYLNLGFKRLYTKNVWVQKPV